MTIQGQRRRHVLVIEDHAATRDALVVGLERAGFTVTAASNGATGLRLARLQPPDLLLLDLVLPEIAGADVLAAVRHHPALARVPVVAVTGRPDLLPPDADVQALVKKPFDMPQLLGTIERALQAVAPATRSGTARRSHGKETRMPFTRILVGLDGTRRAETVLPLARGLAQAMSGTLLLVRVVPSLPLRPQDRDAAELYLERLASELRRDGFAVEVDTPDGEPAVELLGAAESLAADLIVLATRGHHGLERALFGSVAEAVVGQGRTPVLLLGPGAEGRSTLETVVVPVDDSPGSALGLGAALGIAAGTGARLVLVQVRTPLPIWVFDPTLGLDTGPLINPQWNEDARTGAQAHVDALADRLQRAGVTAEGRGVLGEVAPAIVTAANEVDADLIVMSTHAYTGPARALLGSVADAVVRTARRPVLLVRRNGRAEEADEADEELVAST